MKCLPTLYPLSWVCTGNAASLGVTVTTRVWPPELTWVRPGKEMALVVEPKSGVPTCTANHQCGKTILLLFWWTRNPTPPPNSDEYWNIFSSVLKLFQMTAISMSWYCTWRTAQLNLRQGCHTHSGYADAYAWYIATGDLQSSLNGSTGSVQRMVAQPSSCNSSSRVFPSTCGVSLMKQKSGSIGAHNNDYTLRIRLIRGAPLLM